MRSPVWTPEQEEWLLKKAWKKMTLQQISNEINISTCTIGSLYKKHGIKPITQRDLIASHVLDIYNSGEEINISRIAGELGCSQLLVSGIIKDFKLDVKIKRGTPSKIDRKKINAIVEEKEEHDVLKRYHNHLKEKENLRAKYAVYNQTGSELTDHVRQINTTERPNTYLTNSQ